jgi:hypothetical protein
MTAAERDAITDALQRATAALQAGDADAVRTWSRWAEVHATAAYRAERGLPAVTS